MSLSLYIPKGTKTCRLSAASHCPRPFDLVPFVRHQSLMKVRMGFSSIRPVSSSFPLGRLGWVPGLYGFQVFMGSIYIIMYSPQPVDTRGARTLMACKINYKRCKDLKFWNF